MTFDSIRGSYSPSLYYIFIKSNTDFGSLRELWEIVWDESKEPEVRNAILRDISTFFHEYIHFIQDTTTYYGLDTMWNVYSQVIEALKHYQNISLKGKDHLEIDPDFTPASVQLDNIRKAINGPRTPTNCSNQELSNLRIVKAIQTVSSYLYETEKADLNNFLTIGFELPDGQERQMEFGAICIVETMAHLMQAKFFYTEHADYPYMSAKLLAQFLVNRKEITDEEILMLCDLSLLSPYPGFTFFELCNYYETNFFEYENTEHLIEILFANVITKWNPYVRMQSIRKAGLHILSLLSDNSYFRPTIQWLESVLEHALKYRLDNHYFILEIYRSKFPFSIALTNFLQNVGGPEVKNYVGKRWVYSPDEFYKDEDFFPGYLAVLNSIRKLFVYGYDHKRCDLYTYCSNSEENPMPTDLYCATEPWIKSNLQETCPYGAYWKYWKLNFPE